MDRAREFALYEKTMNKKKRKRIYKMLNVPIPKGRPRNEEWVQLREQMWNHLKSIGMAQLDMVSPSLLHDSPFFLYDP